MYWILFRRETDNVHYLWNGLWPICVHVPPATGTLEAHVWPMTNYESAVKSLKNTVQKRVLKFDGDSRRYIIVARGEFTKE